MTMTPWTQDEDVLSTGTDPGTFTVLDEAECRSLLHDGVVGRVAFTSPHLGILPITYDWVDNLVVYRTAPGSTLARLEGQQVAFEVDDIDAETAVGWSVQVLGTIEPGQPEQAAGIRPWAPGDRALVFTIRPSSISGRVVSRPEEE